MNQFAGLTSVRRSSARFREAGAIGLLAIAAGCSSSTGVHGVTKIDITPPDTTLRVHGQVTLHASLVDGAGQTVSGSSVFWSSEDSAIATVSSNGVVTGMAPGGVRIAASADGVSATATVTVSTVRVASITLVPDTLRVAPKTTGQLLATAYDGSGNVVSGVAFTWGSSNPAVATTTQAGAVTGVAGGSATVTASAAGQTGSAAVIVAPITVASVTIVPETLSVAPGAGGALHATAYDASGHVLSGLTTTWGSASPAIATVDTVGNVSGVATGSTTISASMGGKTASATVIVGASSPVTLAGCNGGTLTETTAASIIVTSNIDNGCTATLKSTAGSIELRGTIDHQSAATLTAATSVTLDQQIQGGSAVQITAANAVSIAHDVTGMVGDTAWSLRVFDSDSLTIGGNVHGAARAELHSRGPIVIGGAVHDVGTEVLWWAPLFTAQGGVDPLATVMKQNWGGFPDQY